MSLLEAFYATLKHAPNALPFDLKPAVKAKYEHRPDALESFISDMIGGGQFRVGDARLERIQILINLETTLSEPAILTQLKHAIPELDHADQQDFKAPANLGSLKLYDGFDEAKYEKVLGFRGHRVVSPLVHYVLVGRKYGIPRSPAALKVAQQGLFAAGLAPRHVLNQFDEAYYRTCYDIDPEIDAFAHYHLVGRYIGHRPQIDFCPITASIEYFDSPVTRADSFTVFADSGSTVVKPMVLTDAVRAYADFFHSSLGMELGEAVQSDYELLPRAALGIEPGETAKLERASHVACDEFLFSVTAAGLLRIENNQPKKREHALLKVEFSAENQQVSLSVPVPQSVDEVELPRLPGDIEIVVKGDRDKVLYKGVASLLDHVDVECKLTHLNDKEIAIAAVVRDRHGVFDWTHLTIKNQGRDIGAAYPISYAAKVQYFQSRIVSAEPLTEANISVFVEDTDCMIPTSIVRVREKMSESGAVVSRRAVLNIPELSTENAPEDIMFFVDEQNDRYVRGWAKGKDDAPVLTKLSADGEVIGTAITHKLRRDVQSRHGGSGYVGFDYDLPLNLLDGRYVELRVGEASWPDAALLEPRTIRQKPMFSLKAEIGSVVNFLHALDVVPERVGDEGLSVVVVNLDGGSLLRKMLDSIKGIEVVVPFEIIVIDHGSQDDTEKVLEEASEYFPVRYINRGENFSFSNSNNFGAECAKYQNLLFLNNDVVLTEDIFSRCVNVLGSPEVGVLGFQLRDYNFGAGVEDIIQHLGVFIDWAGSDYCPFEARMVPAVRGIENGVYAVPAVTGAALAIRREVFEEVGGFDNRFFYGYEDIDLCLRVTSNTSLQCYVDNTVSLLHMRGFTRTTSAVHRVGGSINVNKMLFDRLHARRIAHARRWPEADLAEKQQGRLSKIAFVVSEIADNTAAGDYYTALELARELNKLGKYDILFMDRRELAEEPKYNLRSLDYIIVMIDGVNVGAFEQLSPHAKLIAWARNWVDRWASHPWAQCYDMWLASSSKAVEYLKERFSAPVRLFPIATNYEAFSNAEPREDFRCDVCFTGSYFGAPRKIMKSLRPEKIKGKTKVFGHGWDAAGFFSSVLAGSVSYNQMPSVYASSKVLVDDANHVTNRWGSVNSRVFDAIAGGALPITNGSIGVSELFGDLCPSYQTSFELTDMINGYLKDEDSRVGAVQALQKIVVSEHTYAKRAAKLDEIFSARKEFKLRVAIKIAAPNDKVCHTWGDYHFACSLARQLEKLGVIARVDCLDKWYAPTTIKDDVNIVLRGLERFKPAKYALNIMWLISHPDKITDQEIREFDHVFSASSVIVDRHAGDGNISYLPQCTDPDIFNMEGEAATLDTDLLFVGNSRGVYRDAVRYALDYSYRLTIYGGGWEQFIGKSRVTSTYVDNKALGALYRSGAIILNDHWESMRKYGIISNRCFDVAACGGRLVSDSVADMTELFGPGIACFTDAGSFQLSVERMRQAQFDPDEVKAVSARVIQEHSFEARAQVIFSKIEAMFNEFC